MRCAQVRAFVLGSILSFAGFSFYISVAAALAPEQTIVSEYSAKSSTSQEGALPAALLEQTQGQAEKREPNILELSLPNAQPLGIPVDVRVLLTTQNREPVPNREVSVRLVGKRPKKRHTDLDGTAIVRLDRTLSAGGYNIVVVAKGIDRTDTVTATGVFTIQPASLTITTVPPLPNIGFSVSGRKFYSGEDGVAQIQLTRVATYSLELLPMPENVAGRPARIEFARWLDNVFSPKRELDFASDRELSMGLVVSHQIGQSFTDLGGNSLDGSSIISFTLKNSLGTRYVYEDPQPRWQQANRISRQADKLVTRPIEYAVESVIIRGMNVVNENQQRFVVADQETWVIKLLLYSMRIQATDAILGTHIGTGVELTFPDGYTKTLLFEGHDEIFVDSLARGLYTVKVIGANGMAPLTPVSLSRDQDVDIKVLSAFDIRLGLIMGMMGALGVLFYGRPTLLLLPISLLRRIPMPPRAQMAVSALFQPMQTRLQTKKVYMHSLVHDQYKVQVKGSKDRTLFNLMPLSADDDVERFATKESSEAGGNVPKHDATDWSLM